MAKFINLAFILYIVALLRLAVFRNSFSLSYIFEIGNYNLELFSDLAKIYQNDKKIFAILFFGNLGWFFPFGVFLRYKNFKFIKIVLFGFLFSLSVESSQFIFKSGIFEIDDLLLNTIGTTFGILFVDIIRKIYVKKYYRNL